MNGSTRVPLQTAVQNPNRHMHTKTVMRLPAVLQTLRQALGQLGVVLRVLQTVNQDPAMFMMLLV